GLRRCGGGVGFATRTGGGARRPVAAEAAPAARRRDGIAPGRRVAGGTARRSKIMRGLIALVLIAAIVAIVGFLADNPGRVEIVWRGWRIETSAAVLAALLIAVVAALLALIALIGGLLRLPGRLRRRRESRRRH